MRLVKYFVVIVILIFILLLTIPHSPSPSSESDSAKSKALLSAINSALLRLKVDIGRLPNTDEGLALLFEGSEKIKGWNGPYLLRPPSTEIPQYKNVIYHNPGVCDNGTDYDLYLSGRNEIDECGKGDDISLERKD